VESNVDKYRDLVVALLRGASEPMPISDVWRGLQNRGVDVSYTQVEDWLLDQSSTLVQLSVAGFVSLRPRREEKHIRPAKVVPDRYEDGADTDASTRMHRLLAYYKDCLLEEGKAITAYREQENTSFVLLPEELHVAGKDCVSVRTSDSPNLVKNLADGTRTAFYGYPLMLEWIETGDGEFADYKVIPVFIARLEIQQEPARCLFHLDTKSIRLNPVIMARSKWRDRAFVRSRLDADAQQYATFEERLEMIEAVLPDVKVCEPLDPRAIVRAKSLHSIEPKRPGLFNRCGIFLGGSNPYVLGLIRDLDEMLTKSQGHFEQTSLASLFRTKSANLDHLPQNNLALRVFSPGDSDSLLNAPQELAVEQAFGNNLSVITGPPGTGKSQVVASIITTAVLHDKTVLFASRNNKALEVVQERLKKTCADPHALIRVGGDYDGACSDLLQRMGNLPPRTDSMPFHRQMQSIELHLIELEALNKRLDDLADALGRASLAEDRFDVLKKKFLPKDQKAYEKVKGFEASMLLTYAQHLEALLNKTIGKPLFLARLLIWMEARKGRKEVATLHDALVAAGIAFSPTWPSSPQDLQTVFRSIFPVVDLIQTAAAMSTTTEEVGAASQLSELYDQIHSHKASIAKKVPALLAAKVRENTAGQGMSEKTQEAVQHYRETMPQLKGKKLNEDQLRVRLESLGNVFPEMLHRLPAWAVTNLSVSHRVPLEPGVFDLVVIDEASQCDIPSCLPLLYRAKQAVIIGDPLQLPQITQVPRSVEDLFLRRQELNGPENDHLRYSEKSMFDAAQAVTPRGASQFLASHYRCHPDIIRFANSAHWYEDRLDVFTDISTLKRPAFWRRGVEWVQVASHPVSHSSKGFHLPEEVRETIAIVKTLLEDRKYEGTVGVVCPLRGMVDLIRDGVDRGVDARLLEHAHFEAQTAHGFQGDERDVIIYAMAVHPDMPRGARWFIAENKNLFNVALSRARACFVVVGDKEAARRFSFEDKPVEYLQQFVAYVDQLGDQQELGEGDPVFAPEQLWEERFYLQALKPAGIPAYSQYALGPYKLDFAVLRKDKQRKLDIEIDGESYHKDNAGKRLRRDIDRDIFVKAQDGRNWDIMRFWVYELREDMTSCLTRIQQWINSAP
jgi:very-short-patch-repair endonuclease